MWFGGLPGKIIWQSFMSVVTFLFLWHRKHIKHLFIVQRRWNVRHQQRTNNNISEKRGLAASVIILIDRTWRSCWVGRNWVGLKNVFVEAKYILTLCPRLTASLFGPLKQQNRTESAVCPLSSGCYFSHENRFDSWVCFRRWTCFSSQEHFCP